jgi:predicted heme/steroid binding protein/DMSO/TMAO reductase YedYZ heme-binding membrane subunit
MPQTFTLKDLARFDGREGRPAYIAVDGTVYDVSASARWAGGQHVKCDLGSKAGRDLSSEIKSAPKSMRGLVAQMPVVGSLVTGEERGRPAAKAALPALAVLLLAVPFIAMGLDDFNRPPVSLITLRTLGLVAFTLLFIDVVVGAFRPLFTRVYKARPLQRAHAVIGGSAFVLALVHGTLMLNLGIKGYPWQVKLGPTVLALLFVVILTALNRRRLRLGWRWIHRLNYVLFGLIIGHAFALGYNLITQPFMKVIFVVYAGVAAIGFGYRLVQLVQRPRVEG